jgi:hypothetical protein
MSARSSIPPSGLEERLAAETVSSPRRVIEVTERLLRAAVQGVVRRPISARAWGTVDLSEPRAIEDAEFASLFSENERIRSRWPVIVEGRGRERKI